MLVCARTQMKIRGRGWGGGEGGGLKGKTMPLGLDGVRAWMQQWLNCTEFRVSLAGFGVSLTHSHMTPLTHALRHMGASRSNQRDMSAMF